MAKRLQLRGGTTAQHSTFTGAVREVTVDTDKNTLVINDGSTAGGHPLATATNFKSTGIDDNATSNAITIDSSERVGIGKASPSTPLHITKSSLTGFVSRTSSTLTLESSGGTEIYLASPDSSYGQIRFGDTASTYSGGIQYEHNANHMLFQINDAERMRITSAGVLLIGKTSTDNSVAGSTHYGGGQIVATVANDDIMILNRTGTDGKSLRFFKDTSEVGAIDVSSTGIGITLGGTGTANLLDDYEEGTFTPQVKISGDTLGITYDTQIGTYTKIGRVVTININIALLNKGSNTNNVSMIGLPFTSVSNSVGVGAVSGYKIANTGHMWIRMNENGTTCVFNQMNSSGTASILQGGAFSNDSEFQITATYLST